MFPLEQGPAETAAEVDALAQSIHEDGQPIKILIAEDNKSNAEILLEIFREEGFEVVHAQNGREAVQYFSESEHNEFDMILMDIQMPVIDGCSASTKIRQLDRSDAKSVLIFACTANTFQEDQDRAMKSGMNDFLAKPIDVKILLKKIKCGSLLIKKVQKI